MAITQAHQNPWVLKMSNISIRYYIDVSSLLKRNTINPFYNLEYHLLKRFKYPYYITNISPIIEILESKHVDYNMNNLIKFILDTEKHILPHLYLTELYFVKAKALTILNNKYLVVVADYEEGIMDTYNRDCLGGIVLNKGDVLLEINLAKYFKEHESKSHETEVLRVLTELIVLNIDIKDDAIKYVSDYTDVDSDKTKELIDKHYQQLRKYVINKIKTKCDKDLATYNISPYKWINDSLWVVLKEGGGYG